jgi:nucleoside-diphosphate-sugar epimerase
VADTPPLLVTGGTGYVGSHVAAALADTGVPVHLLARPASTLPAWLPHPAVRVWRIDGSLASLESVFADVRPGCVVHLAALVRTADSPAETDALVEANFAFGTRLLAAARIAGCTAFLNTGTFWQHRGERTADAVCLYAALKAGFEDVLAYHASAHGMRALTLLLYDTYGPADPRPKLLSLLARAAAGGERLEATPGRQALDLVHVRDVAAAYRVALARLLGSPAGSCERFAVRTGHTVTVRDLATLVGGILGRPLLVDWGARDYRPREIMEPPALPALPGWTPAITLAAGLREALGHPPAGPPPG